MRKPIYKYPYFGIAVDLCKKDGMCFWLKIIIHESKAKTVYNVSSYIYHHLDKSDALKGVGSRISRNFIPHYETYSNKLEPLKNEVFCAETFSASHRLSGEYSRVFIARGDHPSGIFMSLKLGEPK